MFFFFFKELIHYFGFKVVYKTLNSCEYVHAKNSLIILNSLKIRVYSSNLTVIKSI
jgi:hypothetical protein